MKEKMIEIIKEILLKVTENEVEAETWNENTDILNEIGLDSIQLIEFLLMLEENVGIEFEYENLEYDMFSSIRKLADELVEMKRKTKFEAKR